MCRIRNIIMLILIAMLALPASGCAEALHEEMHSPDLTVEAVMGYDGVMTYGKTMPARIRLENHGADMTCTVAMNVYVNRMQYNRYEMEISLAAAATKEIVLPVFVGSKQDTFTVEVWKDGEKFCAVNTQPSKVLNPSAMLVGVLSDAPQNLSYMNIDMSTDVLLRNEYIQTVPLNAQNFPEELDLLSSFGVLMVDGFDIGLLSANQQQVLQAWLEAGHILIVGGGAQASTAWPAVSGITGLTPGELVPTAGVAPALLQWLGISGQPLDKEILLTAADGGHVLVDAQGVPLIWRDQAGSGMVYTTAFSLGDRELSGWEPMRSFWQRLMIKDCYTLYQRAFQNYTNEASYAYESSRIPLTNDVPLLPAAAMALAILLIGGTATYILLRRFDKRQWLWLVLPVLAAVSTVVVCVMAVSGPAAQPTVLSLSVLQQGEDGLLTRHLTLDVATPERGEQLITVSDGVLRPNNEERYYDYDESKKLPATLNYRYVLGEKKGLGIDLGTPWTTKYFRVKEAPLPQGNIDTSVWMEDDGLHGYIHNQSSMSLGEGVFLCRYGYCSIPAIAPGEKHEFVLTKSTFAVANRHVYEDGKMYEALAAQSGQPHTFVEEYFFKTSQIKEGEVIRQDPEKRNLANLMTQVIDQTYRDNQNYYSYYASKFHYAAFTQDVPGVQVFLNGQEAERTASRAVFHAVVPFDPDGSSGKVYRVPGTDKAIRVQLNPDGSPIREEMSQSASAPREYHRLSEQPAFMFRVKDAGRLTISRMAFYTDYMPKNAQAYLYNGSEWIAYDMGTEVKDPQQFVDEDGCICLQFRMPAAPEDYYEIYTPSMMLEGRTK